MQWSNGTDPVLSVGSFRKVMFLLFTSSLSFSQHWQAQQPWTKTFATELLLWERYSQHAKQNFRNSCNVHNIHNNWLKSVTIGEWGFNFSQPKLTTNICDSFFWRISRKSWPLLISNLARVLGNLHLAKMSSSHQPAASPCPHHSLWARRILHLPVWLWLIRSFQKKK